MKESHIRFKKISIIAITILLIGVVFVSVNQVGLARASNVSSQVIIGLIGNPADPFNPITQIDLASSWVQDILYGTLLTISPNGSIIPYLAQSYSISSDGLNYTFYLYHNLKWSDGAPLTSQDIKFSLEAYIEYSTRVSSLLPLAIKNSTTPSGYSLNPNSVLTPNNYTIIMHLSYPSPQILSFFAAFFRILPEHVDKGQDLSNNAYINSHVVTSGPWYLASPSNYTPGQKLILSANPYFFKGIPRIKTLIIQFFQTADAAETALKTGSIQMLAQIPFSDVSSLKSTPGLTVTAVPALRVMFVQFNMNTYLANGTYNPVSNILVREALGYATNITALVNSVSNGYFRPWGQAEMYGMEYLGYPAWNSSLPAVQFPYNITKANELLNEAGYPWNPKSGNYRMTLTLITLATVPYFVAAVQILKSEWAQVGINLVVKLEQSTEWAYDSFSAPQPKTWNLDFYDLTEPPDPFYPVNFLFGLSSGNAGNFTDPTILNLIYNVSNRAQGMQRALIFQDIDSLANRQVPYLFLASETIVDAWSSNLNFTDGLNGLFTHPLSLYEMNYITSSVSSGISQLEIEVSVAIVIVIVGIVVAALFYLQKRKEK